jgi:hypothetical protein
MSGQQNQPIDLNTPMTINLPLGAWNTVLGLIAKGPWDVADPLMQVMRAQLQQAQQQRQNTPSPVQLREINEKEEVQRIYRPDAG